MRVLWTHNFDPSKPNSQVFMNIAAEGLRARGIDLHCEYLGNLRSIRNLAAARKRLRRMAGDFDVVHAQYGSACALATSAIRGIPKVLSIRGNDWAVYDVAINFHYFHTRLARWMTRTSIRSYDVIATVSKRVAAEVQAFAPKKTIVPLPSPVDLQRFVPLDRLKAREALGFPANREKWVLFNALNLDDPVKRFGLAKRAFEIANASCGGNMRLRVANGLSHEELPLFTAACDAILCTSETEGWPNCVKEALACNVPFVATDVSDLHEIAREEASCRISSDDPEVLARNLCEVLSLSGVPDLRRHVAPMSLDTLTDRLIAVYQSLLSPKGQSVQYSFAN